MKERIKKFGLRIWSKIEDHLAKYIAGVIIAISVIACISSGKWLTSKHSLEMYGFVWIAIIVGIIFLSALTFWLTIREPKKKKLTNKTDIKIELDDYWKNEKQVSHERRAYKTLENEFTISCRQIDKHRNLKRGSTSKFLPEIIEDEGLYTIVKRGKDKIHVQRKN